MTGGVGGITGGSVIAAIKGEETCGGTVKTGGHHDGGIADGEVDESAVGEAEEGICRRLTLWAREAVEAVLLDGIIDGLGEVAFEFAGGDGDAVQEEDEVEGVFVVQGVADLADDAKAVGGVAGHDAGVHGEGGFELGEGEGGAEAEEVDAVAEDVEGAALVEGVAEAAEDDGGGLETVGFGEGLPSFGLGGFEPRDEVRGKEGGFAVVAAGGFCYQIWWRVEPAIRGKVLANFNFEVNFAMEVGHLWEDFYFRRFRD